MVELDGVGVTYPGGVEALRDVTVDEVRAGSLRTLSLEGVALVKELWVVRREGVPAAAPARRFTDFLLAG